MSLFGSDVKSQHFELHLCVLNSQVVAMRRSLKSHHLKHTFKFIMNVYIRRSDECTQAGIPVLSMCISYIYKLENTPYATETVWICDILIPMYVCPSVIYHCYDPLSSWSILQSVFIQRVSMHIMLNLDTMVMGYLNETGMTSLSL